jgi:8-oxo-dGTP diphosphatase
MARDLTRESTAGGRWVPRVREGAKALVSVNGRCLLVKERHADGRPFWTLPGGGLESDEPPTTGLKRELREELSCRVAVDELVGRFWYAHTRADVALSRYVVFDCRLLEGVAVNQHEGLLDYRWVRPSAPPARTLPQVCHLLESAD